MNNVVTTEFHFCTILQINERYSRTNLYLNLYLCPTVFNIRDFSLSENHLFVGQLSSIEIYLSFNQSIVFQSTFPKYHTTLRTEHRPFHFLFYPVLRKSSSASPWYITSRAIKYNTRSKVHETYPYNWSARYLEESDGKWLKTRRLSAPFDRESRLFF